MSFFSRLGHKFGRHHRVGHKHHSKLQRFTHTTDHDLARGAEIGQQVGGAMATAGAIMTATGVGAPLGAALAGAGAGLAGVSSVVKGGLALKKAKDTEDVVDAGVGIVKGVVGARGAAKSLNK
tara:strand:- start:193 stop:561 length:369 start_codon:yes stop_codon:yes gene_type:complete